MIDYSREQQKAMALSGVCSAVLLVKQLAHTGKCDTELFKMLMNSILETQPDSTLGVYQTVGNLQIGLNTLIQQLENNASHKDIELTRYIISLLALEKHLRKKPDMIEIIGSRIEHIKKHNQHKEADESTILTGFAGIYLDTISTLPFRVQVSGNPMYLKMSSNQEKVRALLLAGIRSIILWRQLGGSRLQILFKRKRIIESARSLLNV